MSVDSSGTRTERSIPEIFGPLVFNGVVVVGDNLYVLCGEEQSKVYKYSGWRWTYHCNLGEPCASLLNFEDQFLIAGTMGVNAKILKIPF